MSSTNSGKCERLSILISPDRKESIAQMAESLGIPATEYMLRCEEQYRTQYYTPNSSQQNWNMNKPKSLPMAYGILSNYINIFQDRLILFTQNENHYTLDESKKFIHSLIELIDRMKEELDDSMK